MPPKRPKTGWEKLQELRAEGPEAQATVFLHVFEEEVKAAGNSAAQVMEMAAAYKKEYPGNHTSTMTPLGLQKVDATKAGEHEGCLAEVDVLRFLEAQGNPMPVMTYRKQLRKVCEENKGTQMSFVEYLLMTFNKTLDELFQTKDDHPELLKKVDEALNIAEEHETRAEARARKIAELEALAAQGGVKGTKAKHELALLLDAPTKEDDQARIDAQARGRRESATLASAGNPVEQKIAADLSAHKEAEKETELAKRKESQEKLKARGALFGL